MKTCAYCLKPINDAAWECPNCHRSLFGPGPTPPNQERRSSSEQSSTEEPPSRATSQEHATEPGSGLLRRLFAAAFGKALGAPRRDVEERIDDPVYEGRPISHWVYDLQGNDLESINATTVLIKAARLAVPQLTRNLKNPNIQIRKMIPLILAKIGPSAGQAIQALSDACSDSNLVHAIGSRFALIMITGDIDKHLRVICKALESDDAASRRVAAHSIGMIGPKALPAARRLFEMRQREADPVAYKMASDALHRIGWDPAIGGMAGIDFY